METTSLTDKAVPGVSFRTDPTSSVKLKPIERLPAEIIDIIVDYLYPYEAILLGLSSKYLYHKIEPDRYKTITIRPQQKYKSYRRHVNRLVKRWERSLDNYSDLAPLDWQLKVPMDDMVEWHSFVQSRNKEMRLVTAFVESWDMSCLCSCLRWDPETRPDICSVCEVVAGSHHKTDPDPAWCFLYKKAFRYVVAAFDESGMSPEEFNQKWAEFEDLRFVEVNFPFGRNRWRMRPRWVGPALSSRYKWILPVQPGHEQKMGLKERISRFPWTQFIRHDRQWGVIASSAYHHPPEE